MHPNIMLPRKRLLSLISSILLLGRSVVVIQGGHDRDDVSRTLHSSFSPIAAISLSSEGSMLKNAVVVTINTTGMDFPAVSEIFPRNIVVLNENYPTYQTQATGRRLSEGDSFLDGSSTAIIVIYNRRENRVCDWGKGHLVSSFKPGEDRRGGDNDTDTDDGFRIVSMCLSCDENDVIPIAWSGNSDSIDYKAISFSSSNAFVYGLQWNEKDGKQRDIGNAGDNKKDMHHARYHRIRSKVSRPTELAVNVHLQESALFVSVEGGNSGSKESRRVLAEDFGIGVDPAEGNALPQQGDPSSRLPMFKSLFTGPVENGVTYTIGSHDSSLKQDNQKPSGGPTTSSDSNHDDNIDDSCVAHMHQCCEDGDCPGGQECFERKCVEPCSVLFDECCDDLDCPLNQNNICFVRTCVDEGYPRFSLSWYGDDDLDLYVITPFGVTLYYQNDFDPTSGGRLGESVDQYSLGFHAENIYFPVSGSAPLGDYGYYVQTIVQVGDSDPWTLVVSDFNGEVSRSSGVGNSPVFTYTRQIQLPSASPETLPPQSPTTDSTNLDQCLVPYDECCETKDCIFGGDICVHRNCIDDGFLRITLQWIGNDDLDIFVVTPEDTEISFNNQFDPVTLGRFGEDTDQLGSGFHIENIYFPREGAPAGRYQFFVRPFITIDTSDEWTIEVVEDGDVVMTETGFGRSEDFFYDRQPQPPAQSPHPALPTIPIQMPSRPPVGGPAPTAPMVSLAPAQTIIPTVVVETPVGLPTKPPLSEDDCSVFIAECCMDSDCGTTGDLCEQRTCIRDGNPRITLTWTGDDDLDLFVRTPDGAEISSKNTFDAFSRGRYERDTSQSVYGHHIENIYFPLLGSPTGNYEYGVRSVSRSGESDTWYIEIHEGNLIETRGGSGDSVTFSYIRRDGVVGPQRPRPPQPRCSPVEDECCVDSDCLIAARELCIQRTCINEGSLRITLEWTGDDDLDLFVVTPGDAVISRYSEYDPVSGGQYGENPQQLSFGFQVENIYFPFSGAPKGTYRFYVESTATRGIGADVWMVGIYENGEKVQQETGIGNSRQFLYERVFLPTSPIPPEIPAPPPLPTSHSVPTAQPPASSSGRTCPDQFECCSTTDCVGSSDVCVQRTCIRTGSLRFDLIWTGNDQLNLIVMTPQQVPIGFQNPLDQQSGAQFEQDPYQPGFGFHVESVAFPQAGAPVGEYSYFVRSTGTFGEEDMWSLRVYESDVLVALKSGTGDSRTYIHVHSAGSQPTKHPMPSLAPNLPPSGLPPSGSISTPGTCETNSDCEIGKQVCIQEVCISEGNPRFTLQWIGNDDLELVVVTPFGVTISSAFPFDPESGGTYGQPSMQNGFGKHVENIYFPMEGGPSGLYSYSVMSSHAEGSDDSWIVSVSVNGEDLAVQRGSGNSDVLSFEFGGEIVTPSPQPETCIVTSDCGPKRFCVNQACVGEGNPQFVLTWNGDDDLDLYVITPLDTTIYSQNSIDIASGGQFDGNGVQDTPGWHIENIYFGPSQGPNGVYQYYVQTFRSSNDNDNWTVTVYVDTEAVSVNTGQGSSDVFFFDFQQIKTPTLPPVVGVGPPTPAQEDCDPFSSECCSNAACLHTEVCTSHICIDEGAPRFTLTWEGENDLDLLVLTPLGTVVSFANADEPISGGMFGEEFDQFEYGQHVENIYFSNGGPAGEYSFFVKSFLAEGFNDLWTVQVFVDGEQQMSVSGMGDSDRLIYLFEGLPPTLAPTQTSTSNIPPSTPVSENGDCDIQVDECCSDSECVIGVEVCTQHTCIDNGYLRFTLTWNGDDDLDLVVATPVGSYVSFAVPIDEETGGVFGEGGAQYVDGHYVENIFFPSAKAPTGTYLYNVTLFEARGSEDEWTVSVFLNNMLVASEMGKGDSEIFSYVLQEGNITSQPPEDDVCDPLAEECCNDADCASDLEVCILRTCINRGLPRFTLEYIGDDAIDLTVVTPFGSTISGSSPQDNRSEGKFEKAGGQEFYGTKIQSIYFPLSGGPFGTYTYYVSVFDQNGSPDTWTVRIFEGDIEVAASKGEGEANFLYDFGSLNNTAPTQSALPGPTDAETPTQSLTPVPSAPSSETEKSVVSPVVSCQIPEDECCQDTDCLENEVCRSRTCVDEGNPRFTLTWNSVNDYNLAVTPPIGSTISYLNQIDEESGGRFGENGVQLFPGLQVENIFFPLNGGPIGTYVVEITVSDPVSNPPAPWTLEISVNGQTVHSEMGSGLSKQITYNYEMGSNLRRAAPIDTCSITVGDSCCTDADCSSSETMCVAKTCIRDGHVRFTLTWNGDDDLDLIVVTPDGTRISYNERPNSPLTAVFEASKPHPGLVSGPQLESIFFPTENAPSGVYKYRIETFNSIGEDDPWTLQVFLDGNPATEPLTGTGPSTEFTFEVSNSGGIGSDSFTISDMFEFSHSAGGT